MITSKVINTFVDEMCRIIAESRGLTYLPWDDTDDDEYISPAPSFLSFLKKCVNDKLVTLETLGVALVLIEDIFKRTFKKWFIFPAPLGYLDDRQPYDLKDEWLCVIALIWARKMFLGIGDEMVLNSNFLMRLSASVPNNNFFHVPQLMITIDNPASLQKRNEMLALLNLLLVDTAAFYYAMSNPTNVPKEDQRSIDELSDEKNEQQRLLAKTLGPVEAAEWVHASFENTAKKYEKLKVFNQLELALFAHMGYQIGSLDIERKTTEDRVHASIQCLIGEPLEEVKSEHALTSSMGIPLTVPARKDGPEQRESVSSDASERPNEGESTSADSQKGALYLTKFAQAISGKDRQLKKLTPFF